MSDKLENTKKHSGGPKTPEGKKRSCMNSVRHGLTALTVVLPGEDPEKFKELLEDYIDEYAPATKLELDLVHELAATRWRVHRIWVMESTLLHVATCRNAKAAETEFENPPQNIRTAFGFMDLIENGKSFTLLNRYEMRLSRRLHQIMGELDRLQAKRQAAPPPAPEPAEVTDSPDNPNAYRVVITLPKQIVRNELAAMKNSPRPLEKNPPKEEEAA